MHIYMYEYLWIYSFKIGRQIYMGILKWGKWVEMHACIMHACMLVSMQGGI